VAADHECQVEDQSLVVEDQDFKAETLKKEESRVCVVKRLKEILKEVNNR
jgi:hypothetical protein